MLNAMIENETDRRYCLEEQKAIAALPSEMAERGGPVCSDSFWV